MTGMATYRRKNSKVKGRNYRALKRTAKVKKSHKLHTDAIYRSLVAKEAYARRTDPQGLPAKVCAQLRKEARRRAKETLHS